MGRPGRPRLKLEDRCRVDHKTGCWNWWGAYSGGHPRIHGRSAGRYVWEQEYEQEVPQGYYVLRTCHNHRCVNPDHLGLKIVSKV